MRKLGPVQSQAQLSRTARRDGHPVAQRYGEYRWVVAVQRSTVSQRTLDRYPRVLVAYGPRVCVPRTCAYTAACSLSAADSVAATQTARNVGQRLDRSVQ